MKSAWPLSPSLRWQSRLYPRRTWRRQGTVPASSEEEQRADVMRRPHIWRLGRLAVRERQLDGDDRSRPRRAREEDAPSVAGGDLAAERETEPRARAPG